MATFPALSSLQPSWKSLRSQTGSFSYLWGPRRRPAHMQASRQRRPRQTPTMMPVTECTSKESDWGERGDRTGQGQEKPRVHRSGLLVASSGDHWHESHSLDTHNLLMQGQKAPTASQRPQLPLSNCPPHWTSESCGPSPSTICLPTRAGFRGVQ